MSGVPLTAGQEALVEAMRFEQARIYGSTFRVEREPLIPSVAEALTAGATDAELARIYGWDTDTARDARKNWMRTAASTPTRRTTSLERSA